LNSLADVPGHLLEEIRHFFGIYKDLEPKKTGVEGWEERDVALRVIRDAQERFRTSRK